MGARRRIVLLPGDGIGPEVVAEAAAVLRQVAGGAGLDLKMEEFPVGGAAIDASG